MTDSQVNVMWSAWRSTRCSTQRSTLRTQGGFLCCTKLSDQGSRRSRMVGSPVAFFAAVCATACVGFFWRAFTAPQPIVELRAFADRNFAIGSLFSFILGIGLYGSVYLVPLFLGRVRGYDSLQIGETMFVTGLGMFLAAPVVGRLSRSVDLRALLAFGMATTGAALWLTGRMTNQWAFPELWLPLVLRGVGMMFQDYALFPWLTVAQNIAFDFGDARRHRARVDELLREVGLEGRGDSLPKHLSGGQAQRATRPEPAHRAGRVPVGYLLGDGGGVDPLQHAAQLLERGDAEL